MDVEVVNFMYVVVGGGLVYGMADPMPLDRPWKRVAWWFKHHCKGSRDQISVMLLNLKEACVDSRPVKLSKLVAWCPPSCGAYKFNVDGSVRSSPGWVGMGGV
ncbi:hypothetical protein Dsin_005685 [Dipteronia sinensis]|uniref:Uncharacterized protein n=1 Tax=Dipteronia sinensis TaxID=43782 RepID=A0AAE0AWZ3_9ROSI|nr:hypothetical protein Dsin_005685 [Dipteronia sinensis]